MDSKRRGTQEVQAFKREMVIVFLKEKKGTQQQAAALYQLSERSVRRIWQSYKSQGAKAMVAAKRGVKKKPCQLNSVRAAEVRRLIDSRLPDALHLPFTLWTRAAVQQLVVKKYGIEMSLGQVGRMLCCWGYTPQKPLRQAFEQDSKAVTRWLRTEYVQLRRKATRQGAHIYFLDETGMRSDHQTGSSYSRSGKTPVVKATGKRFSANLITAMSREGAIAFSVLEGKFNAGVFQQFLARLIRYKRRKIYLIADGHPAHRAKWLQQWLKQNSQRIELVFLPAYSPELNPVEYLNQDLKTNIVGKKRPINKEQLCKNVEDFMNSRKNEPQQTSKYFQHQKVKYAA